MKKRIVVLLLLISVLLSACGKSAAPAPTEAPKQAAEAETAIAPAPEKTPAPTEAPKPEKTPEPTPEPKQSEPVEVKVGVDGFESGTSKYVSRFFYHEDDYTDSLGNDFHFLYAVPEFDVGGGSDATWVNAEIQNDLMGIINDSESVMATGNSLYMYAIEYHAAEHGDLASVLVRVKYDNDFVQYYIWSMNAAKKEAADDGEITAAAGMSESEAASRTKERLERYCLENVYLDLDNSFVKGQYERTISEENLSECRYFIDNDGTLKAVVNIYLLAGAEYLPIIITVSE